MYSQRNLIEIKETKTKLNGQHTRIGTENPNTRQNI